MSRYVHERVFGLVCLHLLLLTCMYSNNYVENTLVYYFDLMIMFTKLFVLLSTIVCILCCLVPSHPFINTLLQNWKKRWFVLYRNELKYFASQGSKDPLRVIHLNDVTAVERDESLGKNYCFK